MPFPVLDRILSRFHARRATAVAHDADDLVAIFGDTALQGAALMALREESGPVATSRPGHWHQVQQDLANRLAGLGATARPGKV